MIEMGTGWKSGRVGLRGAPRGVLSRLDKETKYPRVDEMRT